MKIRQSFLRSTSAFFAVAIALTACGNPLGGGGSRIDTNYGPAGPASPPVKAVTGFEMIGGSQLLKPSVSQAHQAEATAGSAVPEVRLVSSKNKIVYLNVQGQLISR